MRKKFDSMNLLRLVICSDLRKNLLICLNEDKKSLGDLRNELNISSTTAIHALRELEKSNLTFQDKDKNYALTTIGRIITLKLVDFSDAAEVLKKHERFWLEHDLGGIPDHMMEKIGWLKGSAVMQINTLDILKTHSSYVSFIKDANWIKGVSPIFSADYPIIFKNLVENNVETHLVLTEAVLKKLIYAISLETFKNLCHNYKLKVLITDKNIKVAFTVTDSFLSLGLFTNDEIYDTAYDLIGTDNKAISWGVELFKYYRGKTKEYEI